MNDADRRQTSDGFDPDAMFADIVAHWNDAAPEPGPTPRPSADEAPGDAEAGAQTADQPPVDHHHFDVDPPEALPTPAQPQAIPAPQAWRAHEVDPEYEEHFEPPPTAPLPVGDLQFWAIIAGMCGGPLLLLYLVLFNREAGSGWMLTAIAMSVGGFALLISRLPRDHEDDDDGARL
ncbi:MAG TPA: hypothetical protein VFF32_05660 [Dermatophilaceae bacterium]|nr:hypothetical protein [Dermatophilaceae bacterium]